MENDDSNSDKMEGCSSYHLLLCSTGQLHAVKAVKFGYEGVFKGPDVLIISFKHSDKHLLKNYEISVLLYLKSSSTVSYFSNFSLVLANVKDTRLYRGIHMK